MFVMPSRCEAHSVAFLEALASGIPIVASRIPSFAFASGFPGVQLVDTDDVPCYADAVVAALGQARAQRSLAGLTLRDTAARYRAIAHQVSQLIWRYRSDSSPDDLLRRPRPAAFNGG